MSLVGMSLVGLMLFFVGTAGAQVGSATITGSVLDASGAAVPNAQVTLTDVANETKRTQTTSKDGFFSFVNLAASTYQASVTATRFSSVGDRSGGKYFAEPAADAECGSVDAWWVQLCEQLCAAGAASPGDAADGLQHDAEEPSERAVQLRGRECAVPVWAL
jgi:hypothetical protein